MTLTELIKNGFFPKEIVPLFNSKSFGEKVNEIQKKVKTFNNPKISSPINYSIPRLKNTRRKLAIPNPFFQFKLSETLVDNWIKIEEILNTSTNSLSKPLIKTNGERAIERLYPYSEIAIQILLYSFSKKYLLKLDISRFYSTIYTHSIPWAFHGKALAKQETGDSLFGNKIDKFIRKCQDNQTLGIPTGPDTSFLLSELIGIRIDNKIKEKLEEKITFFRYMDDYFFFTKNLEEVEKVINIFNETIQEYELEINPEKTEIKPLPQSIEFEWVSELRKFIFSKNDKHQRIDMINFFNKVIIFNEKFPKDFVFKYALNKIKYIKFNKVNWDIFQSFLLNIMSIEPSTIQVILDIFLKYDSIKYKIEKYKLQEVIYDMLEYHSKYKHNYEITWLILFCKYFKLNIKKEILTKLIETEDPLVLLMILDLKNKEIIKSKLDESKFKKFILKENLYNEYWILAYEIHIKKWIHFEDSENYLKTEPFYTNLYEKQVSFYNDDYQMLLYEFNDGEFDKTDDILQILQTLELKINKSESLVKKTTISNNNLDVNFEDLINNLRKDIVNNNSGY